MLQAEQGESIRTLTITLSHHYLSKKGDRMRSNLLSSVVIGMLFAVWCSVPAWAANISGVGSTFVYPVLSKWAVAYKAETGVSVNYQSLGSGGGIKQIQNRTVDFGASDAPLDRAELDKAGLAQFPILIGGIVPIVNLPGIELGKLKLTGPILADIFLGKIKRCNEEEIVNLNPDLKLPDQAIAVVHRADGSGTTYVWADYLSKVSTEWKKVGVATSLNWPVGLGGKGNEGVAALTSRTSGAIGYVEYAYAKQTKLNYAYVQNKEGMFVQPNKEAFQAAASNAEWAKAQSFNLMLTDQPGKDSWPITGAVFILMHKVQRPENARTSLQFFHWIYWNGQSIAEQLDFVPMPLDVVRIIECTWKEIKSIDNVVIWQRK